MTKWKQRRDEREKQRDAFAAEAMVGLLSGNPATIDGLVKATKGSGSVSELAYIMADAMLKARTA